MKSLRALSGLSRIPSPAAAAVAAGFFSRRFYSAQPQADLPSSSAPCSSDSEAYDNDAVFDSSQFTLPGTSADDTRNITQPTWDEKYRSRADKLLFGEETPQKGRLRILVDEEENRQRVLARALLEAAIEAADDEEAEEQLIVKDEDQKSLAVGIIGAPNAGKSALTNFLVRISRKFELLYAFEILGIHYLVLGAVLHSLSALLVIIGRDQGRCRLPEN